MRMQLPFRSSRHHDRGHRRGIGAAENRGNDDAAPSLCEPVDDVASIGDPAHRHHTSQVLNGLMWKGPNSWFGKTGKTTAVRTKNLVKVRISTGATWW